MNLVGLAVNTIENVTYNQKERFELSKKYFELEKSYFNRLDEIMEIEDDQEYHEKLNELENTVGQEKHKQYTRCFAAQFHKTRNAWFTKVVNGYELNIRHRISGKQYDLFSQYACDTDKEHWRTHEKYCRCGNKFVTLYRNSILVESLEA